VTDRMTSPPSSCYSASCDVSPKWGVASSVKHKNPDGSDLTLYTCDVYSKDLTGELRGAGTKYTLFPINGPHIVAPPCVGAGEHMVHFEPVPIETPEGYPEPTTKLGKALFVGTCVVVGIIIGPFILVYYLGLWLSGWRPPAEDK